MAQKRKKMNSFILSATSQPGWHCSMWRPLLSLKKDLPPFHPTERPAKLGLYRQSGTRKKGKSWDYQNQPHSWSHHGSQWPAPHMTAASVAIDRNQWPTQPPPRSGNSAVYVSQVFPFTLASYLSFSLCPCRRLSQVTPANVCALTSRASPSSCTLALGQTDSCHWTHEEISI